MNEINSQPQIAMLPTLEQLREITSFSGSDGIAISGDIARTKDVETIKEKLTRDIEEAKQAGDEQLTALRNTMLTELRNLKDETHEDIIDLQQGLKVSVVSNQKAETEIRGFISAIWENMRDLETRLDDNRIIRNEIQKRLNTAYECLFVIGVVIVAETGYLIYKFF